MCVSESMRDLGQAVFGPTAPPIPAEGLAGEIPPGKKGNCSVTFSSNLQFQHARGGVWIVAAIQEFQLLYGSTQRSQTHFLEVTASRTKQAAFLEHTEKPLGGLCQPNLFSRENTTGCQVSGGRASRIRNCFLTLIVGSKSSKCCFFGQCCIPHNHAISATFHSNCTSGVVILTPPPPKWNPLSPPLCHGLLEKSTTWGLTPPCPMNTPCSDHSFCNRIFEKWDSFGE